MKQEVWYNQFWSYLYSVAVNYQDSPSASEQTKMQGFLQNIWLPDQQYMIQYDMFIKKNPYTNSDFGSRKNLIVRIINLNNAFNKNSISHK